MVYNMKYIVTLTGSQGPRQYFTLHWNITPYDSVNLNASYTDCSALPSGVNAGNIEGSTGHLQKSYRLANKV